LKYCHEQRVPVVPQGGNTGMVGGSVPHRGDEVVLSLSRMNKIHSFDPTNAVIQCQSGCILDNLNEYLRPYGYVMPLDLGSSGSCQIGGNVATNAGGIRFLRYGSLRSNILGLKVVLANGDTIDLLNTLRKDNTGYDLKHLFIGSEGTLGVITDVCVATPMLLANSVTALLGLDYYEDAVAALSAARNKLGESIAAIEYWDSASMRISSTTQLGLGDCRFYLLVEVASNMNLESLEDRMMDFLGMYSKGVLATDEGKKKSLWKLRENIPLALKGMNGHTYKYDVSMSPHLFNQATLMVQHHLAAEYPHAQVFQYGHLADGNLHLNIWSPTFDQEIKNLAESTLYEFLRLHRGSISAEHGIGVLKAKHLNVSKSEKAIATMRNLKFLFDPYNILNPNKVLN